MQYKQQDEDVLTYALFPQVATEFFKYREAQQTKVDPDMLQIQRIRHTRYDTRVKSSKSRSCLHEEDFELGTRQNMRMQRFSKKISESECF